MSSSESFRVMARGMRSSRSHFRAASGGHSLATKRRSVSRSAAISSDSARSMVMLSALEFRLPLRLERMHGLDQVVRQQRQSLVGHARIEHRDRLLLQAY